MPESWHEFKNEILWEPREYQVPMEQHVGDLSDSSLTDITPTSVSLLSPCFGKGAATVTQYVYLQASAKQPVVLPQGSVLGEIELVNLASMDDPKLIAVINEAERQVELHTEQMKQVQETVEKLQHEVFSIMQNEADNSEELRQTTVRHKPETELPKYDIRGIKSGTELVAIWEKLMKTNKQVKDQFNTWYTVGPGSLIKFGEKLEVEQLRELKVLCFAFKDVFSINPKAPPEAKGIEHALYFKHNDPKPHRRPIPQLSRKEMDCMDKELSAMLANHIIQYSDSEWATLPVFAKKKDNTLRIAIDYRKVNSQIWGDNQSIPNIGEVLDSLADA